MTDEKKIFDFSFVDTASSTDDGCPTPSTTMFEDIPIRRKSEEDVGNSDSIHDRTKEATPSHDNHAHHIEHHPVPYQACIIRTREKPHRILGLVFGKLKLLDAPLPTNGIFWFCYESDNWCGFRNVTSGTFLGYDRTGKISATKSHHGAEEYFVPIRKEGGGYILHTFHSKRMELWQVAIAHDKHQSPLVEDPLVEKKKGGTAWDFINAKYVRRYITMACPGMEEECLMESDYCLF
ncbi:hypothetical protein J3F84DRAFT_380088 [Trichoderma pleuroticola]